jgi:hypothetical protein
MQLHKNICSLFEMTKYNHQCNIAGLNLDFLINYDVIAKLDFMIN